MKIVDIATAIYIENGSPTDTSVPAIAYWVRNQIGTLNNLLYENFIIDSTTYEITSEGVDLKPEAIAIIKQAYKLYDWEIQIRKQINALASNPIIKIDDQGTSIQRVNRNMVAQTLRQVRKDEIELFNNLVASYRINRGAPAQVAGDDTQVGYFSTFDAITPVHYRR